MCSMLQNNPDEGVNAMEQRAKDVQLGRRTRKSFSKIREVIDMPNLIEVQKNSYKRFVEEGFWEVLKDASPIVDHSACCRNKDHIYGSVRPLQLVARPDEASYIFP